MARNYSLTWSPPTTGTFPLAASSGNRYFQTASGTPRFLIVEACWSFFVELTNSEQDDYVANAVAHGFNGVMVNFVEHQFGTNAPNDILGNAPFTGTPFASSLGTAYWSRVVRGVTKMWEAGLACIGNPAYAGFNGGSEGFHSDIIAVTQTNRQTYGTDFATKLAGLPNVLLMDFGDYDPGVGNRQPYLDILGAIQAADPTRTLVSNHYGTNVSSHDVSAVAYTYDYVYKWGTAGSCFVNDVIAAGYAASPTRPTGLGEGRYLRENSSDATDYHTQLWESFTCGGAWSTSSDRDIWGAGAGANQVGTFADAINNVGGATAPREQVIYFRQLLDSLPGGFQLGVPDLSSTFIEAADRGTAGTLNYVSATFCSSWGVAFVRNGSSQGAITVQKAAFASGGGLIDIYWYDPRTGGTTAIQTGVAPSGTVNATAPDGQPWVLVAKKQ